MGDRSRDEASADLSAAFTALAEVSRQLTTATDPDVRLDLETVKRDLQARIASIGDELEPTPSKAALQAELRVRRRQLDDLFKARINTMTQTSGDGASPGGYGAGAQEINAAIDESHDRAGVERRIAEIQKALARLDQPD